MKQLNILFFFIGIILIMSSCKTDDNELFVEINNLVEQKNFFKAKEIFDINQKKLTEAHIQFFEIVLDNAFNKIEKSHHAVISLFNGKSNLPDSLLFKIYKVEADNALKSYNYKAAKEATQIILSQYNDFLSEAQQKDYENNLKIYSALEDASAQKVTIQSNSVIKMTKDIAGLNNLKIFANNDSMNFIFDTGANLSTTSESVAKHCNMQIIPVSIEVGAITGNKVMANLAVCPKLSLGNIDIENAIFIVFPDEAMSFPQANYQIYGILGFPVIEAFKEVRITQDDEFIVPEQETEFAEVSNMALDGLNPLVYFNNKHFSFDTGADKTILYSNYYKENRQQIDTNYELQRLSFGGAGGVKEFDGYVIDYMLNVSGKEVILKDIQLLKDNINNRTVYGNIGQDLIQQFDTMILNFDKMFLTFK